MAEASLGCVMSATSLHFSVRKFAGEFVACAGVGFEVVSLAPSLVSIHARQYWRAMHEAHAAYLTTKRFQSTPANTGGRCC